MHWEHTIRVCFDYRESTLDAVVGHKDKFKPSNAFGSWSEHEIIVYKTKPNNTSDDVAFGTLLLL